jgi:hypothetical protein
MSTEDQKSSLVEKIAQRSLSIVGSRGEALM